MEAVSDVNSVILGYVVRCQSDENVLSVVPSIAKGGFGEGTQPLLSIVYS
jgi:hypothetical protein